MYTRTGAGQGFFAMKVGENGCNKLFSYRVDKTTGHIMFGYLNTRARICVVGKVRQM